MAEYIVKETGYPGRLETEIVGELIRCKDCKLFGESNCLMYFDGYDWAEPDGYCHMAERRTDVDMRGEQICGKEQTNDIKRSNNAVGRDA